MSRRFRGVHGFAGCCALAAAVAAAQPASGPEFRANTITLLDQGAAGGAGNFVVVWTSYGQDPHNAVLGQRFSSAGAPVGPEFRVSAYTTAAQSAPSVARGFTGGFVVAWTSQGRAEDPSGVFARRYDSFGAPAGAVFRVNTVTAGAQQEPAVASDGSGNFVIAWQTNESGAHYAVIAQRDSAGRSPS